MNPFDMPAGLPVNVIDHTDAVMPERDNERSEDLVSPGRWGFAGLMADMSQYFLSGGRAPMQGLAGKYYLTARQHNDTQRKRMDPRILQIGDRLVRYDPITNRTNVLADYSRPRFVSGPGGAVFRESGDGVAPLIPGRPQIVGDSTGGYYALGESGPEQVIPGQGRPPQIFGSADAGYHALQNGQVQQLVPGTGGANAPGWGPLDLKSAKAEYLKHPAVETYQTRKAALGDLEALLAKETATADAAAVRLYAKAVNGGGVLSDADVAGLANTSGGIWAQVGSLLEKAKSGELTHTEREQMRQAATELYRAAHAELSEYQQRVLPLLGNHDPSAVFSATGLLGPLETGPQTTAGGFGNGSPLQFAPGVTPDTVIEIPGFE